LYLHRMYLVPLTYFCGDLWDINTINFSILSIVSWLRNAFLTCENNPETLEIWNILGWYETKWLLFWLFFILYWFISFLSKIIHDHTIFGNIVWSHYVVSMEFFNMKSWLLSLIYLEKLNLIGYACNPIDFKFVQHYRNTSSCFHYATHKFPLGIWSSWDYKVSPLDL